MAFLHRLLSVGGETPGFLLPIFRSQHGANQELIQRIDQHDNISSFEPIILSDDQGSREGTAPNLPDFVVDVGNEAVWAFRDQHGEVRIGNASELRRSGLEMLATGALASFPMAAAEMAAFCEAEVQYPEVMRSAFSSLLTLSKRGAEIWRDSVVLLPAIKHDIADQVRTPGGVAFLDVVAISERDVTRIYGPSTLAGLTRLPRWKKLAGIFGINRFTIHETGRSVPRPAKSTESSWTVLGLGGVSDYVFTKAPFFGSARHADIAPGVVIASGLAANDRTVQAAPLLISVVKSNVEDARLIGDLTQRTVPQHAIKHALNIRPIGHGPLHAKPSPAALRKMLVGYDRIWIIANHRQRHTGTVWNSLSVSNVASRCVRAAALGLIACLGAKEGKFILEGSQQTTSFGLFGAARYFSSLSQGETILRVLYSMLCEDALLHSSSKIVILWPYEILPDQKYRSVQLGSHEYEVELISRPQEGRRVVDVVGFALDVSLAQNTEGEFRDLCVSILAGFGWRVRNDDGRSLLLENDGEVLRAWPVDSSVKALRLFDQESEFERADLVISNKTISKSIKSHAIEKGWALVHYSELGIWLRDNYRMGVFKEF